MTSLVLKSKGAECHGYICHGRLPWANELVLHCQSTNSLQDKSGLV